MVLRWLPLLLGCYLLGSVPTAYLVTRRAVRRDIRGIGDGNVGAKNTFLSVGKLAGAIVALVDVLKGVLAMALARFFSAPEGVVLLSGACAILGHDFPIFLRMRGGQGMATMAGVFVSLFPLPMLLAVGTQLVTLRITRNWDWSCAVAVILLVLLLWLGGQPLHRLLYVLALLPTIGLTKLMQQRRARRVAS